MYGIVYGLFDPRDGVLRYVGQTTRGLKKRLQEHLHTQNRTKATHLARWVSLLWGLGLHPRIEELGTADSAEALDELEVRTIAEHRALGARLTNHTEGGGGQKGRIVSAETRVKIATARKGQPSPRKGVILGEDTRAKISASKTGARVALRRSDVSDESIAAMIKAGASSADAAESLGVTRQTIRKRLLRADSMGVPVPILARRRVREEVVRRLLLGQKKEQILQDLQISSSAFDQHCSKARRAGAPIPKVRPGPKRKEGAP